MQTSPQGIAALEFEEGVVLHSYRDAVGVWTIAAGITTAAGVGKVGPGMVITDAQAKTMLAQALRKNYEPAVGRAMTGAVQHEFDAGVSFHFNTGAIGRANWVKLWLAHAQPSAIAAKFRLWNKGGGKVLPGLVKRRDRELKILIDGVYPVQAKVRASLTYARWVLPLDAAEKATALGEFRKLGYQVGAASETIPKAEIVRFQTDHGLAPDGKIGRATLTTLQRRIDAKTDAKVAATAGAGGTATASQPDQIDQLANIPHLGLILAVVAAGVVAWIAWRRRDVIAAKINARAPRVAAFLRSF
ncbi:hypothetical protein RHVG_00026 [Rhodovulum phage RS1]|uniref:endolysin n=1 Tax=Rhodobacter phage RC1 TaxID=754055 RepID=UPI0002C18529|nr:endolysin [Rhodobacter phage RC1]YP_007676405.1 endolysin [Rhodovulum phage RS1]AGH57991.1 hypothetical protein RHVG_00026 [Rhodovulum phage RS1]AGH58051.1 hypothetical protein RHWG_00030 [Rhodobacter phage RC1]